LGRGVACQAVGGAAVAVALAVRVPGFESAGIFAIADGGAAVLGWAARDEAESGGGPCRTARYGGVAAR
jgi:hypothetical protein